ncbi:MAG: Gfo/Idh/MocA family oxidoreductase [Saprospiraceae bacterium]
MKNNRRTFLKQAGAFGAFGLIGGLPNEAIAAKRTSVAPSDQIRFGLIGANGMGWTNMRSHLEMSEVDCVAICDVDQRVLDRRTAEAETIRGQKPDQYKDFRKLLERQDIDAVIIGTPDHWHCLPMVAACQAGKDVYVEKPLANSIAECGIMRQAASQYGRMVQVGQWQRSGQHYAHAIDFVRSGKLGRISIVKVWSYRGGVNGLEVKPDTAAPTEVDYNMWLGPAPKRPFNQNRFHGSFRWYWDYAGGLMTDWGVHEIDIALFAMNAVAPVSVTAGGGKFAFPDDAKQTPDTLQAIYEFDSFNMLWEHGTGLDFGNYGRSEGIAFIGNDATLVVNRQGWEVISETENVDGIRKYKVEMLPEQPRIGNPLVEHAENFVAAVKSRKLEDLKCPIESGSVAAVNAHMGNIAFRTERKIFWDKDKGLFRNDPEASKMITPQYHNGWELPRV